MARDYAKRNVSRKKHKNKSLHLKAWLFVLFLFATFTFGLVFFGKYKQQSHIKTPKTPKTQKIEKKIIKKEETAPRFDFYTISPQKRNNKSISEYELEIATVADYTAADHLKAELVLLGFTVSVTPTHNQKYQVSVGPYNSKESVVADLERLKQNKIHGEIKKIR